MLCLSYLILYTYNDNSYVKIWKKYKPKGVVEPETFPEALSLRLPGGLDQFSPVSLSGLGDESVAAGRYGGTVLTFEPFFWNQEN